MGLILPRLYVILDAEMLATGAEECAIRLADAGVRLIQYRNKKASSRVLWEISKRLAELLRPRGVSFVVNDRTDVALLAGATGVHVGQDDLEVEQARAVVGREKFVGISTHNLEQFEKAAASSADYIAVGPIFETGSKANPGPVVGTELIRNVRPLTKKPIVAIGGIDLDRAPEVMEAGADSVAVISDILRAPDPASRAQQFIERLGVVNQAAAV